MKDFRPSEEPFSFQTALYLADKRSSLIADKFSVWLNLQESGWCTQPINEGMWAARTFIWVFCRKNQQFYLVNQLPYPIRNHCPTDCLPMNDQANIGY